MLDVDNLKKLIIEEAHCSVYVMHPRSTKIYYTIKKNYWWSGMKRDIAEFVTRYLVYQQVKVEHQRPLGTFQSLPIPKWKWEYITMDFMIGLPCTRVGFDAI